MSTNWSAIKRIKLEAPSLDDFSPEERTQMLAAGREIRECYRVLGKGGSNIVAELLRGAGTFYEDDHYPDGDVFDEDTHSQYYYHAHRGIPGEHGHFHTFVRAEAIPAGLEPLPHHTHAEWPLGDEAIAHLGAVSMDRSGFPLGFFMTNRWVTGETWYRAADVQRLIPSFEIDHAVPSWPANRWISALLRLFRPELTVLLKHRDQIVDAWIEEHDVDDVFEDRELEMTGWLRVSVDAQIEALEHSLR